MVAGDHQSRLYGKYGGPDMEETGPPLGDANSAEGNELARTCGG